MSETFPGFKPASPVDTGPSTAITPEYWVAHQEAPPTRSFVAFQVRIAREIAKRSGSSMLETVRQYIPAATPYVWQETDEYIPFDELSDDRIVDSILEHEQTRAAAAEPKPYHEDTRYGCFTYRRNWDDGTVEMHFENTEQDAQGPLSREHMERRLHELKDVFTEVKRAFPEVAEVIGYSWLYNLDSYRRLFPESYTDQPEVDTDVRSLASGRLWGQFQDSHNELKEELAQQFVANVQKLEEITPENVLHAFPYPVLKVRGPIQDFYKKYTIGE